MLRTLPLAALLFALPPAAPADGPTFVTQEAYEVAEGATLGDLLEACAEADDAFLTMSDAVRDQLAKESGFGRTVRLPQGSLWPTVQLLLRERGFSIALLSDQAPTLYAVYSAQDRPQFRTYLDVSENELEAYRAQPALLIRTVVSTANVDPRQLSNSMRALMTELSMNLLPTGSSECVIVSGCAADVIAMASLIREVDVRTRTPQAQESAGSGSEK